MKVNTFTVLHMIYISSMLYFFDILFVAEKCFTVYTKILSSTTVFNTDNNNNNNNYYYYVSFFLEQQTSILEGYLKDHMTLNTGVMMLKIY